MSTIPSNFSLIFCGVTWGCPFPCVPDIFLKISQLIVLYIDNRPCWTHTSTKNGKRQRLQRYPFPVAPATLHHKFQCMELYAHWHLSCTRTPTRNGGTREHTAVFYLWSKYGLFIILFTVCPLSASLLFCLRVSQFVIGCLSSCIPPFSLRETSSGDQTLKSKVSVQLNEFPLFLVAPMTANGSSHRKIDCYCCDRASLSLSECILAKSSSIWRCQLTLVMTWWVKVKIDNNTNRVKDIQYSMIMSSAELADTVKPREI